jgi:hypothetical protein
LNPLAPAPAREANRQQGRRHAIFAEPIIVLHRAKCAAVNEPCVTELYRPPDSGHRGLGLGISYKYVQEKLALESLRLYQLTPCPRMRSINSKAKELEQVRPRRFGAFHSDDDLFGRYTINIEDKRLRCVLHVVIANHPKHRERARACR